MGTIIAATNPSGLLASVLRAHLGGSHRVVKAQDEATARSLLNNGDIALAVVEDQLPFTRELVARIKLDGNSNRTPVLATYTHERSPEVSTDFFILPDEYIVEPYDSRLPAQVARRMVQREGRKRLYEQEITLQFGTTTEAVERSHEIADRFLEEAGFDEHAQATLGHAFREAVGNAAEHGNQHRPDRLIRVLFLRDHEKVVISITDQGPGFDHVGFLSNADNMSALEATRSRRPHEERPGGLGVFILKGACDEVCYNDTGNTIFLKKYLPDRVPSGYA